MSSFRPDVAPEPAGFVPTSVAASATGFLARGGDPSLEADASHDQTAAIDDAPAAGSESELEPTNEWTPERIEALRQEAFEQGAASAREESRRLDLLCDALEAALAPLSASGTKMLAANREQLLALAAEIARHWVAAELRSEPHLYASVLDGAIAAMGEDEAIRLLLSPSDLETLRSLEAARLARWTDEAGLVLEEDASLAAGGYRLDGLHGNIDGRADAILERLCDALGEALEAPPPEDPE